MSTPEGRPADARVRDTSGARVRDTSAQDVPLDHAPRQGRRRRALLLGAGALMAVIALLVVLLHASSTASPAVPRARVRIATVTRGAFTRDVAAEGTVVVANSPTLTAIATGTITFEVVAGDSVTPGQILATLESPSLRNELARERASLQGLSVSLERQTIDRQRQLLESKQTVDLATTQVRASQRELDRMKTGLDQGVVARRDLDKAQDVRDDARLTYDHAVSNAGLERRSLDFDLETRRSDLERQKLLVQDLTRRVDALTVRSPVKGVVGTLLATQKATVAENAPLLTVVDLSALEVEFSVPESYASDLAPQMAADITYAGRSFAGIVTSISPEVQRSEVRGRVRFAERAPAGARQNQRVSVRIVLERRAQALQVERGAFVEAGSFVYRVEGDVARRQSVVLGAMSVGEVEIRSGLHPGDRIIVSSVSEFGDAPLIRLQD